MIIHTAFNDYKRSLISQNKEEDEHEVNMREASHYLGITADTIRYYERIGLVPPITRNSSGSRDLTRNDIQAFEFVAHFRGAGVSIASLREYMQLCQEGSKQAREKQLAILKREAEGLEIRIAKETLKLEKLYELIEYHCTRF